MPIRFEYRHFYRGPVWSAARARILRRAGQRCEHCRKPNYERVETFADRALNGERRMFWRAAGTPWYDWTGRPALPTISFGKAKAIRLVRVVLTIAHLNHTPGDDRDENLMALCQWCHLHYDRLHHRETRQTRKDRRRPLLREAS